LVMLIAFPLMLSIEGSRGFRRLIYFLCVGVILAGIVATLSRGGFLGLVAVLGYAFYRSKAKVAMSVVALLVIGGGLFFIPQSYWQEMSTISTEASTAQQRFAIWEVAFRVWFTPAHFLTGVGMQNTAFWLGDYESVIARSAFGLSIAGRAVHSLWFQTLGDLGLLGIMIVILLAWYSIRSVRRVNAVCHEMQRALPSSFHRVSEILQLGGRERLPVDDASTGTQVVFTRDELKNLQTSQVALDALHQECSYLRALSVAVTAAWLGVLVSATFISVLYYPPIWVLGGLSAAIECYGERVQRAGIALIERTAPVETEPRSPRRLAD
ncbi:MAG: O-antigen ligase family protein, partial [Bdellovibrionales bacterium]|nr:O-antigen ligase family protein [Bdellovibrionales bacterium]